MGLVKRFGLCRSGVRAGNDERRSAGGMASGITGLTVAETAKSDRSFRPEGERDEIQDNRARTDQTEIESARPARVQRMRAFDNGTTGAADTDESSRTEGAALQGAIVIGGRVT